MANLFNYEVNLQPAVMDIRSETLEPISSNTYRYTFRLDQAGELDANSLLLFKPVSQDATLNSKLRVNAFGGGLLGIKRAILQVGDYVLNDINDVGKISNLVDMGAVSTANNSKYNAHYFGNNFHTKVLDNAGSDASTLTEVAHGGEGSFTYDRHRSAIDFGPPNDIANAGDLARVNNQMITTDVNTTPQIGIPLGNLFPAIKGQTIPLFLFQDYRILLIVEFHTCDKWVNDVTLANTTKVCAASKVHPMDVKLQVDYIIAPSEVQNALKQQTAQQGGLNLSFPDIIKIEKNVPAGTANTEQSVEMRIGMDNKEVHSIYMLKQLSRAQTIDDRLFMNARCDGMNQEEYNVNIDGVDVFQDFKYSPSSQYDETTNCLGADLVVPRPVYFRDANTIMSRLADQNSGLLGKYKPLCLDLKNGNEGVVGGGREIGSYPIIWKYKRRPCDAIACASTGGTGVAGDLVEDLTGAMNVDFFVYCSRTANIVSTASGTAVMVSY